MKLTLSLKRWNGVQHWNPEHPYNKIPKLTKEFIESMELKQYTDTGKWYYQHTDSEGFTTQYKFWGKIYLTVSSCMGDIVDNCYADFYEADKLPKYIKCND